MNPDTEFDSRSGFGAAVATALRECADELAVQPDESGLMGAVAEREMAAPPAIDLRSVPSTPSKRRFGWMAAAAALLLIFGAALYYGSPGRRPSGPQPATPGTVPGVAAAPNVFRLVGNVPMSKAAVLAGTGAESVRSNGIEDAKIGLNRFLLLSHPKFGSWWVIGRELPGAPEASAPGDWAPTPSAPSPATVVSTGDGVRLIVTPEATAPGEATSGADTDAAPQALLDWAADELNTVALDGTLPLPSGWSLSEQFACELWLGPDGWTASGEYLGNEFTTNALSIPEGIDPNLMPRWILLAEGLGDPTAVRSTLGSQGWVSADSTTVHLGGANTGPEMDGLYFQLNLSIVSPKAAAAAVGNGAELIHELTFVDVPDQP